MSIEHSPSLLPEPQRVLRIKQTVEIAGVTDMQLRRWEAAGTFPKRFKLNPDSGKHGAAGHDYSEVMEWLAERRASRSEAS